MGICHTKVKNPKNKNKPSKGNQKLDSERLHTDFLVKSDTLIKLPRLNSQERLNSPQTCMLSRRKKTRVGLKMLTTHFCNSSRSIQTVFDMNVTKKYSLIKQINEDFSLMSNNKTGKLVMMQTLHKSQDLNNKFIEWLQSVELDHPNILHMIEIFQEQNQYQVIFQHFNGQPLSCLIGEKTKMIKSQMAQILQQIMEAINYLHTLNIVHGNLTLDSFSYQEKNNGIVIQLINLKGIIVKDEDNLDVKLLTAPQFIYHSNVHTIQRDIWAIGIIGLTLRKGKYPIDIKPNMGMDKIQQKIKLFEYDFSSIKDPQYQNFLQQILHETNHKLDFFLSHQFIQKHSIAKLKPQIQLLQNTLTSKPCCLLQQFIFEFFVKEFNWEEYLRIEKLFYEGDQDMDGFLCKQDIIRLFSIYSDNNVEEIIETLFKTHEFSNQTLINSTHFLTLTANKKELLTKSNIEICFEIFSNNKPDITLRGLRRHLNADSEELTKQFYDLIGDEKTVNINIYISQISFNSKIQWR